MGAGFSRCCGFPLAADLTAQVFDRWKADVYDALDPHHPDWRLLGPLSAFMREVLTLDPSCDHQIRWPDFEWLLTALDELAQFNAMFGIGPSGVTAQTVTDSLLSHLQLVFAGHLQALPTSGLDLIKAFLRRLNGRDMLVCFNWDTLLELAASEAGIEFASVTDPYTGLMLSKPHGSLDHIALSLDTLSHAGCGGQFREVMRYSEPRGTMVVVRAIHPAHYSRSMGSVLKRHAALLVAPNLRKRYESPWIRLQWAMAYVNMTLADVYYLVGYSLPEADLRTRILLQSVSQQRNPQPRFVIVAGTDPTGIVQRVRATTGTDPSVYYGNWEDWLAAGMPESGP